MSLLLMVKLTAILAVVGLAGRTLRRRSAAVRHRIAVLGLASALTLPLLIGALPAWELPVLASDGDPLPASTSTLPAEPIGPVRTLQAKDDGRINRIERADVPAALPSASATSGIRVDPGTALIALWVLGAAFVLLRLAIGWFRMNRIALDARPLTCEQTRGQLASCGRSLGIRAVPRVLVSDELRVPVLWGFVRPTLILPESIESWPADRLRVVLLHEFAHLRRRDGLALLVGRLTAAAWWFHPLVWFLERRARQDCERACDDVVVASGERPSDYARHLLDIAESITAATPIPTEALSIMGPGHLETRLHSILRPGARRGLRPWVAAGLSALGLVAIASIASAEPVARQNGTTPETPEVTVQAIQRDVQDAKDEILLAHDEHDGPGEAAYERATKLHSQERWAEAAAAFEEAADAGYHVGTAMYNAACGYARMGDANGAVDRLERAVEAGFDSYGHMMKDADLDPIRRDPAFQSMLDRMKDAGHLDGKRGMDRYESAVDRYEDLRATDSTDGKAWYEVGTVLLRLQDFDRSIDALRRSSENLGRSNVNALYNLACAYSLSGQSGLALDRLEQAVLAGFESDERFRNDSDLANIRGGKRFAEIEALHDALSLNQYRRDKQWGSEYSSRRWEPAVEDFTAFVERRPDVGRAWSNLGWALHHSRRHAEARDAFTRQLELDFRPGLATYNIACTYAMEGDSGAALEWLGRAVDLEAVSSNHLIHDEDLESLRGDPLFEELVEELAEDEMKDGHGSYQEMYERIKRKVAGIHES